MKNKKYSPLIIAIKNNQTGPFKIHFDMGVDPGTKEDAEAVARLMVLAAEYKCFEICDFIIEEGFDINSLNKNGQPPLIYAILAEFYSAVATLIDYGADINLPDQLGLTSVYYASQKGLLDILQLLIESGADINARIKMDSNIPRQAGMAGSTALLSSILGAVLEKLNKDYNQYYFAELNRVIELRYMKTHCGYQDAYMTTFGGLNFLDFRGKEYYRELEDEFYAVVEPLSVPDLPFVVAHTGIKHNSGDYHKPIRERWLEGEKEVVKGYEEITELAIRGKRALLEGNWEELGVLMNENHKIQDSLSYSGDKNNELIKTALDSGALGAKLAGAGGGGTIIALTLNPEKTKSALKQQGADMFINIDEEVSGINIENIRTDNRSEFVSGE